MKTQAQSVIAVLVILSTLMASGCASSYTACSLAESAESVGESDNLVDGAFNLIYGVGVGTAIGAVMDVATLGGALDGHDCGI